MGKSKNAILMIGSGEPARYCSYHPSALLAQPMAMHTALTAIRMACDQGSSGRRTRQAVTAHPTDTAMTRQATAMLVSKPAAKEARYPASDAAIQTATKSMASAAWSRIIGESVIRSGYRGAGH